MTKPSKRYLVTGGAGYIGSHTARMLADLRHDVTVLDNLETGHRAAVGDDMRLIQLDLDDMDALRGFFQRQAAPFDGVLHFAALSQVGQSMRAPYHYLRRNTQTSLNLIEACAESGVGNFVLSSTAALFGARNASTPIADDAAIDPGSPYGESKLFIENALKWADRIHGLKYASLRYFNAAGADPQGRLGEDHRPETHLIPSAIDAALGRRGKLEIYGNDYPTKDGTCLRDYIHVTDLADAHVRALDRIADTRQSAAYNLGNGAGFSNMEVVECVERALGKRLPWSFAPRRAGDPPALIADYARFKRETGWKPRFADLDEIVRTAAEWRIKHPNGYAGI